MDNLINLEFLRKMNNQLKGTKEYMKYYMEMTSKINNRWVFIGHGVPFSNEIAKIKKVKEKYYLMVGDENRYTITKSVNDLLGLGLNINE